MGVQLGVIADDFTGGTDIASFLVANGVKTIQLSGIQPLDSIADDVQAIVVSLKSRSNPVDEAIEQSLQALELLKAAGARQIFFKYCSTFDSTSRGNIGPVTDALLDALEENFTVVCPALPVNGRTTYQGYLFVNGVPLDESGMRNHPVTPMTDSSLVRLMDGQSTGTSGLVPVDTIERGREAVGEALAELKAEGNRYAVLDALSDRHLDVLGQAVVQMRLVTGGSGLGGAIARALPEAARGGRSSFTSKTGSAVILSGSCSVMTNDQVADYKTKGPCLAVDVDRLLTSPTGYDAEVLAWFSEQPSTGPAPLIFATAGPEEVQRLQRTYGSAETSQAIEGFFARIAIRLVQDGIQRMVVAGGETSGSVTTALGITGFEVGEPIAPGVPWVRTLDGRVDLALKSGNFGTVDFFSQAQ
ncbi:3-oxo-tetronate kinase [Paeniglutamicibacter psychrophenolicus]|uniref:3-oxo-tetronate kinase n=1 Tax=Paeniglutamicibacter psychrophenolicus TaxID=257454 RepID=UPI002782BEC1|nr:3-oxo-tetronate kinase [Paeniglutamicibacter psychrophenolicus]MDQ0093947.1 uncharacterized protein YgbK (DUF1537 family) [Paeniglutamicibacter psychrophenolicus]